ncbi:MAG: sugar ABC transporter permease [Propionibacteriaceae bacterium]|jgi:raffinose/stachyose/melibiose transport system permease protein|nr:sugar ABC transporter permease [Propionibacteriaceae bacterium]
MLSGRGSKPGSLGKYFYLFLLPALAVFLTFSILPFAFTVYYSFTDYTDMNLKNLNFVGLDNYVKALATPLMRKAILNSVIYAFCMTGLQILVALPLAVLVNLKLKTRNFLRAVFFFPAVFSALIVGYLWSYILSSSNYGLVNNLLSGLGLDTFHFFGPKTALGSVILSQIWQWAGWAMVIFLANLQSVPQELYEAADIDGASKVKQFFHVTLPLMAPSVKIIAITSLIGGLKVFDIIYAMTKGGPGDTTETVMTVMLRHGVSKGFYGVGAAFGVMFFIVVIAISASVTKLMGKWSAAIS